MLFHYFKHKFIGTNIDIVFKQFIYLKTKGNPLEILHLMQVLIDNKYVIIDEKKKIAVVSNQFKQIILNEEMIVVEAPMNRFKIVNEIISRINVQESIVLKIASSIGDIFDV